MAKTSLYTLQRGRIVDFSSGQHDAVHPSLLADNEAKIAQNVSLDEKGTLIPRKGIKRRFASSFDSSAVAGMGAYYKKDGTSRLVIAAGTSVYADKPHIVHRFDTQPGWDAGAKSNIDTASTPGDIKVANPPAPTFSRSSVAYKSDGTQVASGVPRFEAGKFGQAVMVEEGATNLLSANQASVETDTTGFINSYRVSSTRDTTMHWHGTASLKVVTPGSVPGEGVRTDAPGTAGLPYTASAYIAGDAGGESLHIMIQFFDASGGYLGGNATSFIATTSFTRQEASYTAPAGTAYVSALARTHTASAATFFVDCLQIEQKPYATSWQYPANGSRSPETLTIPTAGALSASEGTDERWIYLLRSPGANPQYIFDGAGAANQNLAAYVGTDGKLRLEYGTGAATVTLVGTTGLAKDTWYHVAWRWSASGVAVLLNGVVEASSTTVPSLALGANAYLGSKADGTSQLGGLIDDLRISSRARTDAEISADYQSTTALPWDNDTTYKLAFDGNLSTQVPRRARWTSGVLDISGATDPNSGTVSWVADQPVGTELTVETRTSADGVTWSGWANVTNGGLIASPYNSKLQVRVNLGTTSDGASTPAMQELVVSYDGAPTATAIITGLSSGGDYHFATVNDYLIFCNGIDVPKKWDGINAPVDLGGSPPRGKYVAVHKNRVFFAGSSSNPSRLYFSDLLNPDSWPTLNFIDISPEDGDSLTGVLSYGDYLVIAKQHSIWILAGDAPANFTVRRVSARIGCLAPRSLCAVNDLICFVADDGVYLTDLTQTTMASERVRKTWSGLNRRRLHQAAAHSFNHKLFVAVPDGNSTYNNLVLVYDLIRKAWLIVKGWSASSFTVFRDMGKLELYLGSAATGQVYDVESGASDDGAAIEFLWESPHLHFGAPEHLKRFKQVFLEVVPDAVVNAALEVAFITDSGAVSSPKSLTVTADPIQAVKTFRVLPSEVGVTQGHRLGIRLRMTTLGARVGVQGLAIDYFVKGARPSA